MPATGQGQSQRVSSPHNRSWDKRWSSTTSTKREGPEPIREQASWRRQSFRRKVAPSTAVAGRGVAPSRGDVIEAEIADVNGRSRARARGGNFRGAVAPELRDYAVQILGMRKDRKSSWSISVRLRNLKGCKAALHREEWTVVPGEAVRGVDGESAKANARTGKDLRPGIAQVGPALFGQTGGEGLELLQPQVWDESQKDWHETCAGGAERGIFTFLKQRDVFHFQGKPLLNGLFGVEKKNKSLDSGEPVLRMIINAEADIRTLPYFAQWLAISVDEEDKVVIWNELDMTSAFYVFRFEPAGCRIDGNAGVIAPSRSVVGRAHCMVRPKPDPAAPHGRSCWRPLGPLLPIQKGAQQLVCPLLEVAPFTREGLTQKGYHSPERSTQDLLSFLCHLPLMPFDLRLRQNSGTWPAMHQLQGSRTSSLEAC